MLGIGARWERKARQFLMDQGLTLVARNFRCRHGELDLVMHDTECLCFVEVRYRRDQHFGGGSESVDAAKQRRLSTAAAVFLRDHSEWSHWPCRFDVVAIGGDDQDQDKVHWIRDAFELAGR